MITFMLSFVNFITPYAPLCMFYDFIIDKNRKKLCYSSLIMDQFSSDIPRWQEPATPDANAAHSASDPYSSFGSPDIIYAGGPTTEELAEDSVQRVAEYERPIDTSLPHDNSDASPAHVRAEMSTRPNDSDKPDRQPEDHETKPIIQGNTVEALGHIATPDKQQDTNHGLPSEQPGTADIPHDNKEESPATADAPELTAETTDDGAPWINDNTLAEVVARKTAERAETFKAPLRQSRVESMIDRTTGPFLEVGGPTQNLGRKPTINTDKIAKPLIVSNVEPPLVEGAVWHSPIPLFEPIRGTEPPSGLKGMTYRIIGGGPWPEWGPYVECKLDLRANAMNLKISDSSIGALYSVALHGEIETDFVEVEAPRVLEPGGVLVLENSAISTLQQIERSDYFKLLGVRNVARGIVHLAAQRNTNPYRGLRIPQQ
jgi:hypothetical protein